MSRATRRADKIVEYLNSIDIKVEHCEGFQVNSEKILFDSIARDPSFMALITEDMSHAEIIESLTEEFGRVARKYTAMYNKIRNAKTQAALLKALKEE